MADDTNTAERDGAHNIIALSPLPPAAHNERVYGGHGNEIVHSFYTAHQMRYYARQEVFRAEQAWQDRASLAASAGSEPVGEVESSLRFTGGFHVRLYRGATMPEPGTKLYTHHYPPEGMAGLPTRNELALQLLVAGGFVTEKKLAEALALVDAACPALAPPLPASEAKEL